MIPTIHAAAERIRQGSLSPSDLLESCLKQIDRLESRVRAWVFVEREEARAQAARLTDEVRRGRWRGPLHGIPVAIKDIFDVFDLPTAAGSRLWADSIARQDAAVVRKLRQAGVVIVGKTVTTQYASFDPPPTRNPWNPERTPGGSSSGSAAALACGMCLGALASQTGGSITRPATYCGVPSCKPTYGLVSTHGVVPLAQSMDHIGTMARCVRDVALLLNTIAGPDPRLGAHGCTMPDEPSLNCASPEDWDRLFPQVEPPSLGRLRGLFDHLADDAAREATDRACAKLAEAGAEIIDVALPAAFAEVLARHRTVMAVEAAAFHETRLRRHPDDYGPKISSLLEEGLACPAPEYARCKEHQQLLAAEMAQVCEGVDALICPATTRAAPDASTTGDPAFNSPWSYTGLPAVSVPCAWSPEHLPLAVQLVAGPWEDGRLLAIGAWCEGVLGFQTGLPSEGAPPR
jgi:aspartyl-tRNA(Asn)/glutamyl-tRNA(Gln) amidotransferase subunit A